MKLIFSNHYEALESALLDDLAAAPGNPLTPQSVVIPSLAIRRRLELGVARRFGVCANLRCDYLAQWLWGQIASFVPVPAVSPFVPPLLVWRLYRLLYGPAISGADRLNGYLAKACPLMRFELAQRLATLFDHYLTYRPQWLQAWSIGQAADIGSAAPTAIEDAAWQAELWRQVIAELGLARFHPAADFLAMAATLVPDDPRLGALPATAYLFCLPTMPPLSLRLLKQLSRWIDLRLYLLNPCRHYWFEIVDGKQLARLNQRGQGDYHETGNPLLASWGKQTQAQIELLLEEGGEETVVDDSLFADNTRPTLLASLQNAILNLESLPRQSLAEGDHSISLHSCHHLTRQLEVLHDHLLALFSADQPPAPADVLVVTPDLGAAAPTIDAVFGTPPSERAIPYTITGRPASQDNTVARILLQMLSLPQGRFTASEVMALLRQPPLARRFELPVEDQQAIEQWLHHSGIRWGCSAAAEESGGEDIPIASRHTFDQGFMRLFLGYALPDEAGLLVNGVLPCPVGEGAQALALGRFWLFVQHLQGLRHDLSVDRPPEGWRQTLLAALDTFFEPDDHAEEQRAMRLAISEVCLAASAAGPELAMPMAVFRLALKQRIDDPARGGVPGGRVTFAAMSSLRGLPYAVICLLGMDDGAYPGATKPLEFDLMAAAPERGDLQRQDDERNVFLDLLLAARSQLIITYQGRSVHDNAPLPPSVLVSELLDQLLPATAAEPINDRSLAAARRRLVREHPLQAFSPRYFISDGAGPPTLFSFDAEACAAARLVASPVAVGEPRFFSAPLPPPDPSWRGVTLQQLGRFFRNPCRALLSDRMGITLPERPTEVEDDEPFALDWEGKRSLTDRLLPLMLDGAQPEQIEALAQASPQFPDGRPGMILRQRRLADWQEFAAVVVPAIEGILPYSLPFLFTFEVNGEPWQLSGSLTGVTHQGLVRYRCDETRPFDYLAAWLSHLALCHLRPPGVAARSRHLSTNGEFSLMPVAHPGQILGELVAHYAAGLCQPLHFFPKSAWAMITGNEQKASACWQTTPYHRGEEADPYYALALRGEADPLAGDFATLAQQIDGPLFAHLEDSRLKDTSGAQAAKASSPLIP